MKGKIFAVIFLLTFALPQTLNAQWAQTYGGSEDDYAGSIQQTIDGGYIVVGTTVSFTPGYADIWILKFNTSGDVEWQKTYGGNLYEDHGCSIQQTNDGGYIVGGSYVNYDTGPEFGILKLAPNGNIEWLKTYGDDSTNTAYSIQQTIDGGYIVAGYDYLNPETADIVILKLFIDGTW